MDHATEEIPDEADDATSRRHPPAQDPARPAPQRGASLLLIRSRMQTLVLAYLLVFMVLGIIALLRAPEADIPQVIASLRSWLEVS
jgi:hypothetical protein